MVMRMKGMSAMPPPGFNSSDTKDDILCQVWVGEVGVSGGCNRWTVRGRFAFALVAHHAGKKEFLRAA